MFCTHQQAIWEHEEEAWCNSLDEQTAPAAMEPPCPTVSNADIKTVGGVWHSSLLYDFRTILPTVCYVALKEFLVCFEMIVCISYTKN